MNHSDPVDLFRQKFKNFDPALLNITAYPAHYCHHILTHFEYYIAIYRQIIDLAVAAAKKPIEELTLLDYGTGNGFLGMFAKYCGFKKVWASDISPLFLTAAEQTSLWAGMQVDGFVRGDMGEVCLYFEKEQQRPDILLSTDVIEHIYDLEVFFREMKRLNKDMISVFTTASNPYNYKKRRSLHKLQYQDEWVGYKGLSKNGPDDKGFSEWSFYEQRKMIIRKEFEQFPEALVAELALATRGKVEKDIVKEVYHYLHSGTLPVPPKDPFWVCDPFTGSWTERILPIREYERIYRENNFSLLVYNGFYNGFSKKSVLKFLTGMANRFLKRNPMLGKYIAPYIVFLGQPKSE